MTRVLRLEPLTAEAFAPFGEVMDAPALGERPMLGASLRARPGAPMPSLAFSHIAPHALPILATKMERHNLSSQCFVPMDVSRYVVMVAPDKGGAPDMAGLRGFVARGDQAVNYAIDAWHHPMHALDRPARFAVLMWSTGEKARDEEWATLPEPVTLSE